MVNNSNVFKDVEFKTSLFDLKKINIKDIISKLNKILFENRKKINPEKKSSHIYEETVSIVTDIVYLLLSGQRKLNSIYSVSNTEIVFLKHIQKNVSDLGYNNIIGEPWDQNTTEYLYFLYKYFESNFLDVETLSYLVEDTWEKNVETVTASKQGSSKDRRENGSYYTKNELIKVIVSNTLRPLYKGKNVNDLLKLRIVDPAVGSAAFLREVLHQLLNQIISILPSPVEYSKRVELKKAIVENCLFGVDLNRNALKASIYTLWLEVGDQNFQLDSFNKNFIEGDSLLGMHWDVKSLFQDKEIMTLTSYYFVGSLILKGSSLDWNTLYNKIVKKEIPNSKEDEMIFKLGEQSKTFVWQSKFHQVFEKNNGFDAVVGNPPWNKIKSHIKEYFEHYDPSIKNMQGRVLKKYIEKKYLSNNEYREGWNKHERDIKNYAKMIKKLSHFQHQTTLVEGKKLGGDLDLYKFFLEISYLITRDDGHVGFIIPASFTQSEGTTALRELLFNNTQIELLLTVENRDSLFPIDSRFKYAILVFKKGTSNYTDIKCKFMLKSIKEVQQALQQNNLIKLSIEFIKLMSPVYKTIPDLKSEFEIRLLKKIYERHPLINSKNGWKIEFKREVDMTNDSHLFIHRDDVLPTESYVPLYEGRMVHQFDYAAKQYIIGEGRKAVWEDLDWDNKDIRAHYFLKSSDADIKFPNYVSARAGFCDIAGQTNERAVQTALIPSKSIAGNKVPSIKFEEDSIASSLIWIALTNSFVFDWLMRLRISTTINFFHWNQVPLPVLDFYSEEAKVLVKNAARLSFITSHTNKDKELLLDFYKEHLTESSISPCIDPKERQYLRAEIDALVANLYGINLTDLAYVLYQFPLLDRSQKGLKGDLRLNNRKEGSYVTRDLVLFNYLLANKADTSVEISEIYKESEISIEQVTGIFTSLKERVNQYDKLNAIAYVPG